MGYGYQQRDKEIIDYQIWEHHDFRRPFRGPAPNSLDPGTFFCCIGGAQAFGCYVEKPYPYLLKEYLRMELFNMGHAGAGPDFYLKQPKHIEWINRSKFAIVQVMSGRSESNSLFTSISGRGQLLRKSDGKVLPAEQAYNELLAAENRGTIRDIMAETRKNYLANMQKLLKAIKVPKILLWFSERPPDYTEEFDNARKLFGKYPQLVNIQMTDAVKCFADEYVEAVSSIGMPQKLVNRFNGKVPHIYKRNKNIAKIRKFNTYYPSPEMQVYAAEKLLPVCMAIISK